MPTSCLNGWLSCLAILTSCVQVRSCSAAKPALIKNHVHCSDGSRDELIVPPAGTAGSTMAPLDARPASGIINLKATQEVNTVYQIADLAA